MKQIPIKFIKPKRGKNSCQSVYIVKNKGEAACLSRLHATDWSADGSNGVLMLNSNDNVDLCLNGQGDNMQEKIRIRRLTPRECWRLQGFPDEYFNKAKAAGVSDSQLYKQAGNAVTVKVAYAIGLKLKELEEKDGEI